MNKFITVLSFSLIFLPALLHAQINEDKLGAWYMYFFNAPFKDSPWGVQGDFQYLNWNIAGDLEQIIIRGGVTYKPKTANIKFTLGYGYFDFGKYGESRAIVQEHRIHQDAVFPVKFGKRVYTKHRFRFEQRFVENQDFRTRYRYNFFVNIPFNGAALEKGAVYLALYNELFINGQRDIGRGRRVELFDRNRAYAAIGYAIGDNIKVQLGIMNETTDNWAKNQLQVSLHHEF